MVKTSTEVLHLDVQGSAAKQALAGDKVNVADQDKGGTLVANSVSKASKGGMGSSSKDNMGS